MPSAPAETSASAAAAGTTTRAARRTWSRRAVKRLGAQGVGRGWPSVASSRTLARRATGAAGRAARSSRIRSGDDVMLSHPLFQLLKCPVQPGRDRGRADSQEAGRLLAVELEHDAERHDLALSRRE